MTQNDLYPLPLGMRAMVWPAGPIARAAMLTAWLNAEWPQEKLDELEAAVDGKTKEELLDDVLPRYFAVT